MRRRSCVFPSRTTLVPYELNALLQTGFEFRQRRANPILSGVVVAEEFADLLVEVRLLGAL